MATRRACVCGAVDCARHRRRSRSSGVTYGADHQERRRRMLAATPEVCARCGQGPRLNDPWEAGHVVDVARGGGPQVRREHRSCNRKAGAELLKQMRREAAERRAQARIAETARLLAGRSA